MTGKNGKVIVFATSFLDEPVTELYESDRPRRLLEEAAARHQMKIDYRCTRKPSEPLSPEELEGAVAVIADLERYNDELLQQVGAGRGGSLGLIARYGIGYSNVDIEAAKDCGVLVANAPGANAPPTAEWAVATILDVAGRRIAHHQRAAAGKTKTGPGRLDVRQRTLGVIGSGAIGKLVVQLLEGFEMRVLAYDPYPDQAWARENAVEYVDLPTLCRQADFITLHASGGKQIIGEAELAQMKPTAVLVNCARGALVDNRAAYFAVKAGQLWGYGLDEVWEHPDLPPAGINIILSPHVGSDTDEGKLGMQLMSAETVVEFLNGETPQHTVNV